MEKKKDIVLSIIIMVSNRIGTIEKCMEALYPLLLQLPSELIIVDTVGEEKSDGSLVIARKYATKEVHFDWCNDFSAARNAGLALAEGEWVLYQDDDEWFDDVQEFIDFFDSPESKKFNSGYYYTRDYDSNGKYSMAVAGRIVRRKETTRFIGKVHERFNDVQGPHKQFSCFTHHYGYAFSSEEKAKEHRERNMSILKLELEEQGETPRICAQLLQEMLHLEDMVDAGYQFAMNILKKHPEPEWQKDSCAQWIAAATVRYFNRKKDYDGAKKQSEYLQKYFRLSEMAKLVVSSVLANMSVVREYYTEVLDYVNVYVSMWDWKQKNEEAAMLQMNLDMPKYAVESKYYEMLKIGALAAEKAQKREQMMNYLNRLPEEERKKIIKIEKKQPELIRSDIKLTIGMLVSNHKQYIRNVMEGLKPLLNAVPSELVVIDTMGEKSDGSIDIVREYTDKIYRFEWCNDFSAARNFCLDHASGEWFLYQDDDEWFDDVQEFIDFFNSVECDNYYSGYYYTHDYLPGGGYSVAIAGRIIRRTERTRFTGRVHEHFAETFAPNKEFSCFTHHYGYAYENEEQKAAKQKRNVDILEAEIRDEGLTPGRAAQMVQELLVRGETLEKGFQFCLDSIKELQKKGEMQNSCSQWLLVSTVRYYSMIGDNKRLIEQAEKILSEYKLTKIAEMALAATVSLAAVTEERHDIAEKYCDMYLKNWDWKNANPEEALMQVNLDFPELLTDKYYNNIVHIAAATANYKGEYRKANAYWKRLPLGMEGFDSSRYAVEMNRTVQGLKKLQEEEKLSARKQEIVQLLDSMLETGTYLEQILTDDWKQEEKDILTGLQEAAISAGTSLDQMLGEGTEEVALLEYYCELVWQCSNEDAAEKQLELVKRMQQCVEKVKEEIMNQQRIKL